MLDGRVFNRSGNGFRGELSLSDRGRALFLSRAEADVPGYRGGASSPLGIGAAIAVHLAVAGVVLMIPRAVYTIYSGPTITGRNIPVDPLPPEVPADITPKVKTVPAKADPFVPRPDVDMARGTGPDMGGDVKTDGGAGGGAAPGTIIAPPAVRPDPVLVEPGIDPRYAAWFQPAYPGAMIRLSQEGKVVVRVTIGPDGRVIDIERLSATSEAFWLETQRHALRKWRFRPATRDGIAVTGTKTLTVHFRLED